MGHPTWFVNLIKRTFPGRFRLAQLTKVPVIGRAIDRMLFDGKCERYRNVGLPGKS